MSHKNGFRTTKRTVTLIIKDSLKLEVKIKKAKQMNKKKEIEQSVVINKITIIQSLSICSVKFMPKQIEQFTETKAKRNRRTITINQSAV